MSARLIPLAMIADSGDLMRIVEFRQMHASALDMLETCVKEAKNVVHQTQTKMDELAKSIDNIKDPQKDPNLK